MSYLLVTVPLLRKRLAREWPLPDDDTEPGFSLGKWGLPVNVLAEHVALPANGDVAGDPVKRDEDLEPAQ